MSKTISFLVCLGLLLSSSLVSADKGKAKDSLESRYAYTMGYRMGQSLNAQGIKNLDIESFVSGIEDSVVGNAPRLDNLEMNDAISSFPKHLKRLKKMDSRSNLSDANAFLAKNASRSEVTKMRSGLQYEVLAEGSGKQPTSSDTVKVHYHGMFMDGEVFDSSVARGEPAIFNLGRVIAGFREALTNMHVGHKWKIYVPPALGYGPRGVPGSIGANELLIFEIELLEIL
jgi:FKBP-type peptidyl-prolyl cis-trans isomerase FklB